MPLLPLFPLGALALPGEILALQVFEPRYLHLLADLGDLPAPARVFGVIAIRRGHEVGPGRAGELYAVGTAVRIERARREGPLVRLLAHGTRRFTLQRLADSPAPYLQGEVAWLAEPLGDAAASARLAGELRAAYAAYRPVAGGPPLPADPGEDDPTALGYAVLARLRLPLPERQAVLELASTADRLAALVRLIRRENDLARRFSAVAAPPDPGGAALN